MSTCPYHVPSSSGILWRPVRASKFAPFSISSRDAASCPAEFQDAAESCIPDLLYPHSNRTPVGAAFCRFVHTMPRHVVASCEGRSVRQDLHHSQSAAVIPRAAQQGFREAAESSILGLLHPHSQILLLGSHCVSAI